MRQAQHSSFLIYETPYCVWDWDIHEKNLVFLDYFDPTYFVYLAEVHGQQLESEQNQHASLAIRSAYHHALETLFTLLGALAQAPDCVYGWILRCQTGDLENVVNAITRGKPLCNKLGLDKISWQSLAGIVHAASHPEASEVAANQQRFGTFWSRIASEFLREERGPEYNSIKHGLRVASGGFNLFVGAEQSPGVPSQNMTAAAGGSEYGCTFLKVHPIDSVPKLNFRAVESSANWHAFSLAHYLPLAAYSIKNVISALKILNGVPAEAVQFQRPQDPSLFEAPWQRPALALGITMDQPVAAADITPRDKNGIRSELRSMGAKNVPADPIA